VFLIKLFLLIAAIFLASCEERWSLQEFVDHVNENIPEINIQVDDIEGSGTESDPYIVRIQKFEGTRTVPFELKEGEHLVCTDLPASIQIVGNSFEISEAISVGEHPSRCSVFQGESRLGDVYIIVIIFDDAPKLKDEPARNFTKNSVIDSILFVNDGAAVVACVINPALPSGLVLSVTQEGSCAITGVPSESQPATEYVLTGTSASGIDSSAEITITVITLSYPLLDDLSAQIFATTVTIEPLVFTNTGAAVTSCGFVPDLPTGLSVEVHGSTCRIVGTPSATQTATVHTLTATAANGSTDTATIEITVNAANPPVIANQAAQSYLTTVAITPLAFTNTGAAATSCGVSPTLPTGLSVEVNASTCRIVGTPSATQTATVHTVTATAADGSSDTATVSITVAAANPPIIANQSAQNYVTTVAITPLAFTNTGAAATSCGVSPTLPTGLSVEVNASTCRIVGTPSATQTATVHTVTATAADGSTDTATVTVTVAAANPPIIANQSAQNYVTTVAITPLAFTNTGAAATSCGVSPTLPTGLSVEVNASTCRIVGTPSATQTATVHTVTATAADGSTDTATVTVTVAAANPPIIANQSAQNYVTTVAITPLAFTNTGAAATSCGVSPTLPTGLSVEVNASTCRIVGTPTATQTATVHTVTATATDGSIRYSHCNSNSCSSKSSDYCKSKCSKLCHDGGDYTTGIYQHGCSSNILWCITNITYGIIS
jgi:hypothetical protein